eukprot:12292348-Karenia_brevis.AAC.1
MRRFAPVLACLACACYDVGVQASSESDGHPSGEVADIKALEALAQILRAFIPRAPFQPSNRPLKTNDPLASCAILIRMSSVPGQQHSK